MCHAEALSAPNTFWKGTAQLLLHQHTFLSQSVPPASEPEPPAGTGWATAAQRQSQHAGSRKGAGDPAEDASSFELSEYQPAEQVLATAPTGADHNECQMLVKRPLRPKVEVSAHLKLLLQSSEMRQPTQAAFTPCKQIAASTAVRSAGPVVLKKLPQYRHTVGPAPVTMAESTDQPTSLPPSSGQLQSGSAVAAQGVKRPAIQAGAPLVPALLKRPKLAFNSKQPVGKAGATQPKPAASKANAAGKAAAARKAPAGPKAAAKAASAKAGAKAASMQATVGASATPSIPVPVTAAPDAGSMSLPSAATAVLFGTDNIATVALGLAPDADAAAAIAAGAAPAKAPRQRKKADDIDLAEVEKKIQEKFAAGKLADLSIPELKCFLKARKLPVGGKKSDLVARVEPLLTKS